MFLYKKATLSHHLLCAINLFYNFPVLRQKNDSPLSLDFTSSWPDWVYIYHDTNALCAMTGKGGGKRWPTLLGWVRTYTHTKALYIRIRTHPFDAFFFLISLHGRVIG